MKPIVTPSILDDQQRTDVSNAKRLVDRFGENLHWCSPWNSWLVWDGQRWGVDSELRVGRMAKAIAHDVWKAVTPLMLEAEGPTAKALLFFGRETSSRRGIMNMLELAKSERGIPIKPEKLDTNPWRLNVSNGTLDLHTGQLRPHSRDDLLTTLCNVEYDPAATCPVWEAFLDTIMGGNQNLIGFLQRAAGYSLTGDVSEQVLFLLHGIGANGKSTFLNALLDTIGPDYSMQASDGLLLAKRHDEHSTGTADLFSKRLVSSIEVEDGQRLKEALVKQLTGGDRFRARKMRQDFSEYAATHKLWLACNHKPVVKGTDHGMWRRMKLVPFTVTIPSHQQDKQLADKLKAERSGILAWCVQGCLDWQGYGLGEPAEVSEATAEYRAEQDVLGVFLADRCVLLPDTTAKASDLYQSYTAWCSTTGEHAVNKRRFGQALAERGLERYTNNGTHYRGIGLRNDD